MKILDDFSNIFKRYDLDLEATGQAKQVSTDPMMQGIAQFVVDGDDEGILPAVENIFAVFNIDIKKMIKGHSQKTLF